MQRTAFKNLLKSDVFFQQATVHVGLYHFNCVCWKRNNNLRNILHQKMTVIILYSNALANAMRRLIV